MNAIVNKLHDYSNKLLRYNKKCRIKLNYNTLGAIQVLRNTDGVGVGVGVGVGGVTFSGKSVTNV